MPPLLLALPDCFNIVGANIVFAIRPTMDFERGRGRRWLINSHILKERGAANHQRWKISSPTLSTLAACGSQEQ